MAVTADEVVLSALRGHRTENIKLPTPRLIKIYVSSLKKGLCFYLYIMPVLCIMYIV